MTIPISELDVFYISYDEPKAEEHWADLVNKVPWAKRVHGVKGFDSAHKACAEQSETDRFISVDGDNIVDAAFFDENLDIKPDGKYKNIIFSWASKNMINGLVYGNGGLKCWPKKVVLEMKTHENSEADDTAVDFCWEDNYIQMNNVYSETWPNGSPFQAFRAGFREGAKMSLDRGLKIPNEKFQDTVVKVNYSRLLVWCSVGADMENGLWAMYGTRLGCYMINRTDWDFHNVRDFDWFQEFWDEEIGRRFAGDDHKCMFSKYSWDESKLWKDVRDLGEKLRKEMRMDIAEYDEKDSKFFKAVYINPPRMKLLLREDELGK